ncbi:MAG: hypothetical protein FWG12_06350 [Holophagaceae bacterium]|nr:hypothetical protein [Holophagaceae bacterium]
MPAARMYLTDEDRDPAGMSRPGGNAGGGGAAPPAGSTNAMTMRWVDVNWQYAEPEPIGSCTGFEVAVYAGANIASGQLAEPIEYIDDPTARRHIGILELRTQISLRAAVRACYGELRSAWTDAASASNFVPDVQQYSDSGWMEMGNGAIMQWIKTTEMNRQQGYTFSWPRHFPNACYSVSVTPQTDSEHDDNDNWLQLVSFNTTSVRIFKQSSRAGSDNMSMKGFVVGFGY